MAIQSFGGVPDDELPVGTTIFWDDPVDEIPAGWAFADGNNGTADYRDNFIKAPLSVDSTPVGGAGQHSYALTEAQLPPHSHNGDTTQQSSHTHRASTEILGAADVPDDTAFDTVTDYNGESDFSLSEEGAHEHILTIQNAGAGNNIDNRPQFYELLVIEKL